MQLELIIAALRARCPIFENRVAGAAQFKLLPESAHLAVPCAYVVPLVGNPEESRAQNSVRQDLTDSFAVVVALSNLADEKGQAAARDVDSVRAILWAALLGWRPVAANADPSTSRYDGIAYEGDNLLALDRARLWYQYEFGARMEITPEDGWQGTELAALPHFDSATISIDPIDPHDPNLGASGPDGHIDAVLQIPKTGALP